MTYRVIRYDYDCYAVQRQGWLFWKTLEYWSFEAGWVPYVFCTAEEAWEWVHAELEVAIAPLPELELT